MPDMFRKNLCLTFCLVLVCITARAQHPVPPTQVENEIFVIDSNFHIPTKSLPFDRNFKLQFTVPVIKAKLTGFIVVPVDRNGEKSVNRRDYRIYLRTLWPKRKDRKISRTIVPFEQFQDTTSEASIFYKVASVATKGKKSEVTLLMPKLEPRRNYKVRIFFDDVKAYDLQLGLNKPLLEVLTSKSMVTLKEFNTLKENYEKLFSKKYRGDDLFQILSEHSFENDVPISIKTQDLVDTDHLKGYDPEFEMRFIFSRGNKTNVQLKALDPKKYLSIRSDHIPSRISLALISAMASTEKITDANGIALNFTEDGSQTPYNIYLLVSGTKTKLGGRSLPKPLDSVKTTKLTDIVFLGNDPMVIKWKPLPRLSGLEIDGKFIENLKTAVNYAPDLMANPANPLLSTASYQALMNVAISCSCKEIGILKEADRDELIRVLGFVYNLPEKYVADLSKGQIIPSQPYKALPENDTDIVANYESALKTIDILEGLVRMVPATATDPDVSRNMAFFITQIQNVRILLIKNKTALEEKVKASTIMASYFASAAGAFESRVAFRGSTEVYNFTTASKLTFQPDFGLVVIPNFSGKLSIREVVPYLGVNINFRSIDREIPMSKVDNKPWKYYFSFLLGISLTSINIPNKREDLFGTNNSLIAGFGLRLNRYVKVIGGSVIFKTFSTNPLSDRKSIGTSAFAGLSADFEIYELFNGLKKIIK